MKYYYLLNGKIMSSNEKMPLEKDYIYTDKLAWWTASLQPCEISESELEKVKSEYIRLNFNVNNNAFTNPIDVTDIIDENITRVVCVDCPNVKNSKSPKCIEGCETSKTTLVFKQPKQVEEIEAVGYVAILNGRIISGVYKSYDRLKEDYPSTEHCKLTNFLNI